MTDGPESIEKLLKVLSDRDEEIARLKEDRAQLRKAVEKMNDRCWVGYFDCECISIGEAVLKDTE